jgi:16S rRNA (guanine966-N2)-methyltransferase
LRITGGKYRSRALQAPRGQATRPTSDRVREALFGILESANVVQDARVLDTYAGTGALGLEALSRGAARVTLVESSREALGVLRSNIAALSVEDLAEVVSGDVGRVAARFGRLARAPQFDLVLADPPWNLVDTGEAAAALSVLVLAGLLAPDGWLVLEHSARTPSPGPSAMGGLAPFDTRRYGDTALTFYKPDILVPLSL